jgi:hypothetical protein
MRQTIYSPQPLSLYDHMRCKNTCWDDVIQCIGDISRAVIPKERSVQQPPQIMHKNALIWDVDHATINTRIIQPLDLDGMDVLDEFGGHLWTRNYTTVFDSWFSFQNDTGTCWGTKTRGAVVVNPSQWICSNPFSNTSRRGGTFMPPLLNTIIAYKQTMLHLQTVISIKLIKLEFEAQRNRNSSISTYAT